MLTKIDRKLSNIIQGAFILVVEALNKKSSLKAGMSIQLIAVMWCCC